MISKNEVGTLKKTFDDYKHYDEYGREYWNAHELSKLMCYTQYQKFKPAIERARDQMIATGKNPDDHLVGSNEMIETGKGAKREVDSYKLDKYAAYNVAMNADPSKTEVAFAQEYFLQSTAENEVLHQRMSDREAINMRNILSNSNKALAGEVLSRDVKPKDMGIVLDKGDRGMFDMGTKDIKEYHNIPSNRPVADFMGTDVAAYKAVAQINSRQEIRKQDLHGVEDIGNAVYKENRNMRNMFIDKFDDTPEDMMTCEDIKKIEKRYTNQTKEYIEALNYEA